MVDEVIAKARPPLPGEISVAELVKIQPALASFIENAVDLDHDGNLGRCCVALQVMLCIDLPCCSLEIVRAMELLRLEGRGC